MAKWEGWDGVLTPASQQSGTGSAWLDGLEPARYQREVLQLIKRSEELAKAELAQGTSTSSSGDNTEVCAAAYIALTLVTEVLVALGAPAPWGVDISKITGELRQITAHNLDARVLSRQSLAPLLQAARAQRPREPGLVNLEDVCTSLFEPAVGLAGVLSGCGLTASAMRTIIRVADPTSSNGQANTPDKSQEVPRDRPARRTNAAEQADPFGSLNRQSQSGDGSVEDAELPALERFGTDLVALARAGQLDAVFGRDKEVERVLRVLARRNKPNVCLVGPPGVGKTAVVEEVARRIHLRQLPKQVESCNRLIQLSLGSMVGGTKYRGDFEERMRKLLTELQEAGDSVILFIDEIHMALGAGETDKSGTMDAANLLKPALARRQMRCIGATTKEEYERHLKRDKAFERRFVIVELLEPTEAAAEQMLEALRQRFEQHHGVAVAPGTLHAAVVSSRALKGRFLPDRALDILDDAATLASLEGCVCQPHHAHQAVKEMRSGREDSFGFQRFKRLFPWARL